MSPDAPLPDPGAGRIIKREVTAYLLRRHDRPGPRYTSYPTAVEFHDGLGPQEYPDRLAEADKAGDAPLSFYLHLPFCRERCNFCGCHTVITPHLDKALPYLDTLCAEAELLAAKLPNRRKFAQLHLGGGTPTYFPPQDLERLLKHLLGIFEPTADAELAVEVDPTVTTREHVDVLAGVGFNRISLGVQDFTPQVQEAIGRVQSLEDTAAIIHRAREKGYQGTNVDLIYGLPYQQEHTFEETVEKVIELGVDRVALYSFAYLPKARANQKLLDPASLPGPETKLALFALARERFLAAGYEPIGMDHFAQPNDELAKARKAGRLRRNFQGYTVIPAADVLGLGISAIGDVRGAYIQNTKKLATWLKEVGAGNLPIERGVVRSRDDEIRRTVIHELMCNFLVDIPRFEREWELSFADYFGPELARLQQLEEEGLAKVTPGEIRATPVGELFIRVLGMAFDRYWWDKYEGGTQEIFSRTV